MKAAELRQSILQAAVQGKLVPQNPHDEPASLLIKRIYAEKARLIKDGKIKKEKPLPPIADDEIPFDLPDGWLWCRLGSIFDVRDGTHDTPKYVEHGIPLVTSKNLKNGKLSFENVKYIANSDHERISSRSGVDDGDILFAMIGSIGNPVVVNKYREFSIKNVALFKSYNEIVYDNSYLNVLLSAYEKMMKDTSTGGVQSFVSLSYLRNYIVPLPPLSEQLRIMLKLHELMSLHDELELAEKELDDLEDRFAEYLPKSILQAAVQGKLVPQNVHDEPASELLKRIHKEKARLIKEGKIKKEKPLPPIAEDEIPYDLPDGWAWCKLGDIAFLSRGITFPASDKSREMQDGCVRCATTGSVQKEYSPNADVFIPAKFVKNSNQWLQHNDIIMSSANSKELVGKSCLWTENSKMAFGGFLTVIRTTASMNLMYLFYGLQFLHKTGVFSSYSTQTTNIANLNNEMIMNTLFPLPPYNEQQRIVAMAEKLMALSGQLRSAGNQSLKHTARNVVPISEIDDQYEIGLAARGDSSQGLSERAQSDVDELFKR